MNFDSPFRRVRIAFALIGISLWLPLSGGCSQNREEPQFGAEGTKQNDLGGEERKEEPEGIAQGTRSVTYGQLRLALLDYLKRNPGAVTRGRDVLREDLANTSFDDEAQPRAMPWAE